MSATTSLRILLPPTGRLLPRPAIAQLVNLHQQVGARTAASSFPFNGPLMGQSAATAI